MSAIAKKTVPAAQTPAASGVGCRFTQTLCTRPHLYTTRSVNSLFGLINASVGNQPIRMSSIVVNTGCVCCGSSVCVVCAMPGRFPVCEVYVHRPRGTSQSECAGEHGLRVLCGNACVDSYVCMARAGKNITQCTTRVGIQAWAPAGACVQLQHAKRRTWPNTW